MENFVVQLTIIPKLLIITILTTILICYTISVLYFHIIITFPPIDYISYQEPEKTIFTFGFTVCGILIIIGNWIFFTILSFYKEPSISEDIAFHSMNLSAIFLILWSMLSIQSNANTIMDMSFKRINSIQLLDSVSIIHQMFGFFCYLGIVVHCIAMFQIYKYFKPPKNVMKMKRILTILLIIFGIIAFFFHPIGISFGEIIAPEIQILIASFSQYLLIANIIGILMTYIWDLSNWDISFKILKKSDDLIRGNEIH